MLSFAVCVFMTFADVELILSASPTCFTVSCVICVIYCVSGLFMILEKLICGRQLYIYITDNSSHNQISITSDAIHFVILQYSTVFCEMEGFAQ